ncbi:MAG: hypothetical protein Q7V19_09915 [Bacteroidales bacterium]|nr:hypothetical protein [Bacteroidales bacterium]
MKLKRTIFVIAAVGIALLTTNCSKDVPNRQQEFSIAEEDPSALINNFVQQMELYNKGVMLKSGQRMLVGSAVWYIDATLNYTYADAGHAFARLHRDTLYTEMSLVNGYEAAYEEVFDAYETFLTGLSHHFYEEIEGDNKQFMMARVDDMGSLPDNKQKLRIITVTGTGTLEQTGDFGNEEAYSWDKNATMTCNPSIPEPGNGAPVIFEALLQNHFQPQVPPNCRYYYFGASDVVQLDYSNYQLNSTLTNYLDYKIYAASPLVGNGLTSEVACLNYNADNGIHEMQFYFDHLKDFVNEWLTSNQNTAHKKLAEVLIDSKSSTNPPFSIFHLPQMIYRKRGHVCDVTADIPVVL